MAIPVQAAEFSVRNEKLALLWLKVLSLRFSALLTHSRTLWFLSDLINGIPRSFQRSSQNAVHLSFWFLLCHVFLAAAENRDNKTAQKQMCVKVIWKRAARGKGEHAHLRAPGGLRQPWAPAVPSIQNLYGPEKKQIKRESRAVFVWRWCQCFLWK